MAVCSGRSARLGFAVRCLGRCRGVAGVRAASTRDLGLQVGMAAICFAGSLIAGLLGQLFSIPLGEPLGEFRVLVGSKKDLVVLCAGHCAGFSRVCLCWRHGAVGGLWASGLSFCGVCS